MGLASRFAPAPLIFDSQLECRPSQENERDAFSEHRRRLAGENLRCLPAAVAVIHEQLGFQGIGKKAERDVKPQAAAIYIYIERLILQYHVGPTSHFLKFGLIRLNL